MQYPCHAMWNLSGMLFGTSILSDVFYTVVLFGLALVIILIFGGKTFTGRRQKAG